VSELHDAAQGFAHRGWKVFPLHGIVNDACTCGRGDCSSPGKHPLVRRGLYEATTNETKIRDWWSRWPDANIAIATGAISGLVVIDLDAPHADASVARLDKLGFHLSPTLGVITGSGRHLYYASDARPLSNTTRRLPGVGEDLPGVDLRADGGYVVAPPSAHLSGATYRWVDPKAHLAPLPGWIRTPERHSPTASMASVPTFTGDGSPYGLAALQDEIDVLTRAPEGSRNDQLNRSAFALGQLIAGGELAEAPARATLEQTGQDIGLEPCEVRATIESGLAAGKLEPRRRRLS
jgi:hypothetical protein